jgi:hypothetical protein
VYRLTRLGLLSVLVAALVVPLTAQGPAAPDSPEPLEQKLDLIHRQAERPDKARPVVITEGDVNGYLQAGGALPAGVVAPRVSILGDGRISGRAVVDLDAVRKDRKPTGLLDPVNLLRGQVPVTATGVLTVSDGVGRFALESATAGGVPIPKVLLQYILSYYSRTPENPDGLSLDQTFPLPDHIREVSVERGRAIITQ